MSRKITVRSIQPGEDTAVWRVARTLSILERYLFYLLFSLSSGKANALVAVDEERIVGCVVPNVTTLAGEKIGSVDAIFVDRNAQGKGVATALLDSALSRFQGAGCKTLYYVVDRFNSPSWNMAVHHGFDLFEFNEQLRLFSWRIFSLWWVNGYFFNPETFMLRKTGEGSRITKEAGAPHHFFLAWIGFSFILWVMGIRLDAPLLHSLPFVLGVVGVSILAHELSHKLVACSLGFNQSLPSSLRKPSFPYSLARKPCIL
jgi:GNAT superfamily N-acetyltransferase